MCDGVYLKREDVNDRVTHFELLSNEFQFENFTKIDYDKISVSAPLFIHGNRLLDIRRNKVTL